ncbi:MAG: hypothetical protein HY962_06845 [Ignavibacteriae bacterium]|nr:hypothetical protein [Ignavibacteriota bacterium]
MKHRILFVMVLCVAASGLLRAQSADTLRPGGPGTLYSTSLPSDMFSEWLLTLRNGTIVSADASSIRWRDGEILISGTLRDMRLAAKDVALIREIPHGSAFRTAFAGTLFMVSMVAFSPKGTPGYYVGTATNYDNQAVFPSLSPISVLLAAGAAAAAGLLAQREQQPGPAIALDGTENERLWRRLLDASRPRWHIRSAAAFVFGGAKDDWHNEHAKYGIALDAPKQNYYYSDETLDMTSINLGRSLRVGYSVSNDVEVGIGYAGDGVQRFTESLAYTRPGNPPQPVVQTLTNQCTLELVMLAGQYTVYRPSDRISVHVGAGVGLASLRVDVNGYDLRTGKEELLQKSQAGGTVFCGIEYALDRGTSLGLHVDMLTAGSVRIPEQKVMDYERSIYAVVAPFDLGLTSYSVGLSLGINL